MSDLDSSALAGWLRQACPDNPELLAIEKFPGGQSNPTYRLSTSTGDFVLRRKPFGDLLPSAHAVDREFRLISALHPTGFPVARPVAFCSDASVIGAIFYVMEFVEGRLFWDGALPTVPAQDRRGIYDAMIDAQAALHNLDANALGLQDFGPSGNYLARQVQRWTKQYRAAQTDDLPDVERLIAWLPQTVPEQSRSAIIHGDYRIDNVIFAASGPSVRAVLEWELATLGDPVADFAYLALNWTLPHGFGAGLADVDLAAEGLPSLDDAVARYCAATGRDGLPDLHWYFSFCLFRLVGILQGVKRRHLDGNASNAGAADMAARISPRAERSWAEARRAGAPA
jgi:aminoglycoside phosphotransferase (APT) family kinase protein